MAPPSSECLRQNAFDRTRRFFLDDIEALLNIHRAMGSPRDRTVPVEPSVSTEKQKRRGRPPKIDSECLLKIAREVFLERGIRATTLEVAERAGVSEGTLFHRFKTKDRLFQEAMKLAPEDIPNMLIGAVNAISELRPHEALHHLAVTLLDIGKVGIPLMMMSWSNPICQRPDDQNLGRFREFVKQLAAFFEREMDAGRLRRVDSEIVARTFIGAVHHYCMGRILTPDAIWIVPEDIYVRGLVDLILHGTAIPDSASSSAAASPYPLRNN